MLEDLRCKYEFVFLFLVKINHISHMTLFFHFQSLKPNVFSALAQIHAGEVIPMAHFGANFPGWHRIFILM